MLVLFDQGTPVPLRHELAPHQISTAYELGWSTLTNGDLLNAAEQENFDILLTTDKNLQYQQNIKGRRIAIVVLTSTSWPRIKKQTKAVLNALNAVSQGCYSEVLIP